jgi:hypothetical protein
MLPVHHRVLRDGEHAAAMYTLIATSKLMVSIRRLGSPMCCAASPIIQLHGFTNSCRGIGNGPRKKPLQRERLPTLMEWHDRP